MTSTHVTVAIPYVNADPHLGHAYELVLADIHARACRLDGRRTRFLGGTDDYSLKNVLAAEQAGVPTSTFVRAHADRFAALLEPLELSFDDFLRTSSDARHVPAVHRLWEAAATSGDLYRMAYEGDYCIDCERYLDPSELDGGCCPEHRRPVERVAEENWFFRLSRYEGLIDDLITSDTIRITPEPFRNEVLAFVRAGLADISVSRSTTRARGWGVPVPGDDDQVVYVWFDALTNYISALDFGRPGSEEFLGWWEQGDERTHVIGKGILRFHAVYWPAFLASAGLRQPTHIRVHPYLTLGQQKLSKSGGTHLDPSAVTSAYGTDALRWWFARDVNEIADTDFTVERLVGRHNEDLAAGIGNTVNRIATLVHRLRDGAVPGIETQPLPQVHDLPDRVRHDLRRFELRRATRSIVDAVAALNRDLEGTEPWRVARDPERGADLDVLLARHVSTARCIADALEPVLPSLSTAIHQQLTGTPRIPTPRPLVPHLDLAARETQPELWKD